MKRRISYCTGCMGRLHHLRTTYLSAITDNIHYEDVEFVLVNWNSQDGMHDWVIHNLSEFISNGIVKYVKTDIPTRWNMARVKNVAHRLATGDIVCNLDADDVIATPESSDGKCMSDFINEQFNIHDNEVIIHGGDGDHDAPCGRIALLRDHFLSIGGYEERINEKYGWGTEDRDLIWRAVTKHHLKQVRFPLVFGRGIDHDHRLRVENCFDPNDEELQGWFNECHYEAILGRFFHSNKDFRFHNQDNHILEVNKDTEWGKLP